MDQGQLSHLADNRGHGGGLIRSRFFLLFPLILGRTLVSVHSLNRPYFSLVIPCSCPPPHEPSSVGTWKDEMISLNVQTQSITPKQTRSQTWVHSKGDHRNSIQICSQRDPAHRRLSSRPGLILYFGCFQTTQETMLSFRLLASDLHVLGVHCSSRTLTTL